MQETDERVTTATYPPEPSSAARPAASCARRCGHGACPARLARPASLVDDAVLLTSELVTNAVVHAGTQVQVTCRMSGSAVEVAVRDRHPARTLGVSGPPPDDPAGRTSGRGLHAAVRARLGVGGDLHPASKAVWFAIAFADRRPAAGATRAPARAAAPAGGSAPRTARPSLIEPL